MARVQHNLYGCLAVLICLVCTSAIVQAQEDEAFVQYRQKVMTANSANISPFAPSDFNCLNFKLPVESHSQAQPL